jgi:hypothetical protein
MIGSLLPHARWALRTLRQNKSAYLPAIAILALGTGISVAMFSLVDAVLLRPLPFPRQESIQVIWKVDPLAGKRNCATCERAFPISSMWR